MKTHKIIVNTFLLLVSILTKSCINQEKKDLFEFKHKIVKIEGCEYLQYTGAMGYKHIEHKGNCPNTIHCYNKQIN